MPTPDAASGATTLDGMARDVVDGFARSSKQLPSKYLYDALGSQLFEAICELPWYKITRGERALLEREHAAITQRMGDPASLIELGGGSGEKLALLVDGLVAAGRSVRVHLVDISPTALELSRRTLSRHASVSLARYEMAYLAGLDEAMAGLDEGPAMVLFLGSNIGNLASAAADRFLCDIRARLRAGDLFLLGADLIKPEAEMVLAYDDPLGVTAAFNLNLLVRLNRELDGDFDLEQFEHRALWNAHESRVESFLVSRTEQTVCLAAAGCCVRLAEGEAIWTESSHKYERAQVRAMGETAGFGVCDQWIDQDSGFALTCFDVP